MSDTNEIDALCTALQAGGVTVPQAKSLVRAYHSFFTSDYGKVILADLVRKFPVIAPRMRAGESPEAGFLREGSAQVTAYIITRMISRPKADKPTKPAKTGRQEPETQDDIQ